MADGDKAKDKVGVPYTHRLLIKALLRAIALAQSSPGSGVRAAGLESGVLASCLKVIRTHSREREGPNQARRSVSRC